MSHGEGATRVVKQRIVIERTWYIDALRNDDALNQAQTEMRVWPDLNGYADEVVQSEPEWSVKRAVPGKDIY